MLKKCCKRPILSNFSNGICIYLFDLQNNTNHRFLWCKNTNYLKHNAIKRYRGLEKLNDGQFVRFEKIICVQGKKIVYEERF